MQNGDHVWTWNYKTQDATVCLNHPKVMDFGGQPFWATVCTRVAKDTRTSIFGVAADRLATIDISQKVGAAVPLFEI